MSKIKYTILLLVCLGMISATAQPKKPVAKSKKPATTTTAKKTTTAPVAGEQGIFAEIQTSKGKIIIDLQYKETPVTVANFIALAEGTNASVTDPALKGKPFYNGLKFHRVIPDFMIQGGDPQGNGSGGPGYAFKDEITDAKFDKAGILAMANSGPKTNGSQFFITHKETGWLTGKHTIFGYVTKGQDVVNAIKQDDLINSIIIVRKGADAKKFDAPKVFAEYMANKNGEEAKEIAEREKVRAEVLKEFANGQTTASGLHYIVLQEGNGVKPTATSTVKVHYTGTLVDGKVFDSSVQRGEPIEFPLNRVIPGWTEGLQLMKEGAKYKFFIPYNLAYGERAMGPIPSKSDLIFEVELLKVTDATPSAGK